MAAEGQNIIKQSLPIVLKGRILWPPAQGGAVILHVYWHKPGICAETYPNFLRSPSQSPQAGSKTAQFQGKKLHPVMKTQDFLKAGWYVAFLQPPKKRERSDKFWASLRIWPVASKLAKRTTCFRGRGIYSWTPVRGCHSSGWSIVCILPWHKSAPPALNNSSLWVSSHS